MSTPDLLNCNFTDFKKEILRLCYNKHYNKHPNIFTNVFTCI